jgi:hypothetical protein
MAETNWLDDPGDELDELPPEPEEELPEQPAGPTPQELQQLRSQAQVAQRFANDPEFARQVLRERAQQLGLEITEPTRQSPQPQGPPADYVETVRASLSPELQFLAPQIASATWTATQAAVAPLRQQQEQQTNRERQTTYEAMARDLSTEAPGWEAQEEEMLAILGFLRGAIQGSGPMTNPKYGSALKLLYRLASGDAQATATAGRRMGQALRNGTRTSNGGGTRQAGPDLETMIGKAKTSQDKWALAFRHALREHGVSG